MIKTLLHWCLKTVPRAKLYVEKLGFREVKGIAEVHVISWNFTRSPGFVCFPLGVLFTVIVLVNKKILSAV